MIVSGALLQHCLTGQEIAHLLDLMQRCAVCSSRKEFSRIVNDLNGLFAFDFFISVHARLDSYGLCAPFDIINVNYPEKWLEIYMERRYHLIDPILKEHLNSFSLQYWADTYRDNPPDPEFRAAAEGFGLCSGYTTGMKNLKGGSAALFSFAGRDLKKEQRSAVIIEHINPHLYMAVERVVTSIKLDKLQELSPREVEVLKWVTSGKTTWEISVILGIGDSTVKFHVKNIMKKLNAVSRIHAAAIALEMGLVEIE